MADLADRLSALGYEGLFLRLDKAPMDTLWGEPGAEQALAALATDDRASVQARFLAAEILFRKAPAYPPRDARPSLAPVYAQALQQATLGNPWGLPGELDGESGQHLVQLGEPAVAALLPLTEDQRLIRYGGSEEATVGNGYAYRVKDFAAFYLSRIKGLPYEVHESPAARDGEIDRLRDSVRNERS